jgi:hypothetical protein
MKGARLLAVAATAGLCLTGCAVGVGGYGYDDGATYYSGYAPVYGGWNRDYHVGPPPGRDYHPAPPPHGGPPPDHGGGGRPPPSIPSHPAGGGGGPHR